MDDLFLHLVCGRETVFREKTVDDLWHSSYGKVVSEKTLHSVVNDALKRGELLERLAKIIYEFGSKSDGPLIFLEIIGEILSNEAAYRRIFS